MTPFVRMFVAAVIALMATPVFAAAPRDSLSVASREMAEEAADPVTAEDLAGDWEGSLDAGPQGRLSLVVHLTVDEAGVLGATIDSVDQQAFGIPVAAVALEGGTLTLDIAVLGATYAGEVSDDLQTIDGDWRQSSNALDLLLTRSGAADEQ